MLRFFRQLVVGIALILPCPVFSSSVMTFPNDAGNYLYDEKTDSTQVINIIRGDSSIQTLIINNTGAVIPSSGVQSESSTITSATKKTKRASTEDKLAATGFTAVNQGSSQLSPLVNEVLTIHFREFPTFIVIHNRAGSSWTISNFDSTTSVTLPQGTYDIMAKWSIGALRGDVVKENVPTGTTVDIGYSDAVYTANIAPVDQYGNPVPVSVYSTYLIHKASGVGINSAASGSCKFSSISSAYKWEWVMSKYSNSIINQFLGVSFNGFSHDTLFTNTPSDLKKFFYRFNPPPSVYGLRTPFYVYTQPWKSPMSGYSYNPDNAPLLYPFVETAYYMAMPYDDFLFGYTSRRAYEYGTSPERKLFDTYYMAVKNNGTLAVYNRNVQSPAYYLSGDTIEIGLGPMFWCGKFCNKSDTMKIRTNETLIQSAFKNPTFDLIPHVGKHYYTLSQNGSTIWTDTLMFQRGWNLIMPVRITPGTYTFSTQCEDYYIDNLPGKTTTSHTFNTSLEDKDPPTIRDFHILSEHGNRTMYVDGSINATISIELSDTAGALTATAFYRPMSQTGWNPLPLAGTGLHYTAGPPQVQQDDYIALKIAVQDPSGNEMVCTMEPAYYYKAANLSPVLSQISDTATDEEVLLQFSLSATDPNNDALTFSATGLPPGASFDPVTATFSWRPGRTQAGFYPGITFSVSDGENIVVETVAITVINVNYPPELAEIGNKNVAENTQLQFTIAAIDTDGDILTYAATGLPTGASFDPGTATFTWQPTFAQAGTYTGITITVSDGILTDEETIAVTVADIDQPPVLAAIGNKIVAENLLLQFTLSATDPDGDALIYSAIDLPAGASFNASTQTFTWQPNFNQSGVYPNLQFVVSDGMLIDNETVTVTVTDVNRAPVLAAIGNKTVAENSLLQFILSATDPDGDPLTYSATSLPSGATFNASTKTFAWRPSFDQAGSYPEIKFSVSDGTAIDEEVIIVSVTNTNRSPISPQGSFTIGTFENHLVEFTVNASDPDGDSLNFSAINLPSGASFNSSTAVFTWQPDFSQAGSYPDIIIIVSDGMQSVNVYVRITVANNNRPPVLSVIGNKTVAENNLLQFTVTATDPDDDALTYSATGLPSGALFDPVTATFTWQPTFTQAGSYLNIRFTVSDGALTDYETITETVTNTDRAPDLADIGNKTVAENGLLQFTVLATDADNDDLTYSVTGLPTGALFDPGTAAFTWQPGFDQAGTYANVIFTVSDGEMTDEETISITVSNTDRSPVLAAIGNKTITENGLLQFTVVATDADNDVLTYSVTGLPTGASFDPGTAAFTWQPGFDQAGTYANVAFTVSDGEMTDNETITVTVSNTNRTPVAVNDIVTTNEDVSVQISVRNNDSDPDGNPLTVASVLQPSNGTATINTDNTITYLPRLNFNGTDQFTYTIADGQGGTASANVSISVTSINDAPTVAITSPANGAVFNRYSNIYINATAADVDGTITKVEFYRNGTKIGQDTTSPYSYTWSMATAGTRTLYCKAYDNSGTVTQSATRTITVR